MRGTVAEFLLDKISFFFPIFLETFSAAHMSSLRLSAGCMDEGFVGRFVDRIEVVGAVRGRVCGGLLGPNKFVELVIGPRHVVGKRVEITLTKVDSDG